MKTLFEKDEANKIIERINSLNAESQRQWGKMSASQMLAHCTIGIETAMGLRVMKRVLLGYIFGSIAKKQAFGPKPFGHNLPTDKSFKIKDNRDFGMEKERLTSLIRKFQESGPANAKVVLHPFFGNLTIEEWGILQWRHIDHHLQQFGK